MCNSPLSLSRRPLPSLSPAPPDWYLCLDGWNLSREPEPSIWLRGSSCPFSRPRTGPPAAWLPNAGPVHCSLCQPPVLSFPLHHASSPPTPQEGLPVSHPQDQTRTPWPGHQAPSCSAFPPAPLLSLCSAGCPCLASLRGTPGCPSLSATASLTKFSCPSGSGTNVTSTLSHHPTQGELSPCTVLGELSPCAGACYEIS